VLHALLADLYYATIFLPQEVPKQVLLAVHERGEYCNVDALLLKVFELRISNLEFVHVNPPSAPSLAFPIFGLVQHVLELLQRNLVVIGNEELVNASVDAFVQIEHPPVHVSMQNVLVENRHGKHSGEDVYDERVKSSCYSAAKKCVSHFPNHLSHSHLLSPRLNLTHPLPHFERVPNGAMASVAGVVDLAVETPNLAVEVQMNHVDDENEERVQDRNNAEG